MEDKRIQLPGAYVAWASQPEHAEPRPFRTEVVDA